MKIVANGRGDIVPFPFLDRREFCQRHGVQNSVAAEAISKRRPDRGPTVRESSADFCISGARNGVLWWTRRFCATNCLSWSSCDELQVPQRRLHFLQVF